MCDKCNDPRNAPVSYPKIPHEWSAYPEPVPMMEIEYSNCSAVDGNDYECCKGHDE